MSLTDKAAQISRQQFSQSLTQQTTAIEHYTYADYSSSSSSSIFADEAVHEDEDPEDLLEEIDGDELEAPFDVNCISEYDIVNM
jgi:hypothetical protein